MNQSNQHLQRLYQDVREFIKDNRKFYRTAIDESVRGHNADTSVEDLAQDAFVAIFESGIEPGLWFEEEKLRIGKTRQRRNRKRSQRRPEQSEQLLKVGEEGESPMEQIPERADDTHPVVKRLKSAKHTANRRRITLALIAMRKRGGVMKEAARALELKHMEKAGLSLEAIAKRLRKPADEAQKLLEFGLGCLKVFVAGSGKLPAWHSRQEEPGETLFERSNEHQPSLAFTMDTVSCVA